MDHPEAEPRSEEIRARLTSNTGERMLATSGYILMACSAGIFAVIAGIAITSSKKTRPVYSSWLELVSDESTTIVLIVVGVLSALLGKGLLASTQEAYARTIPREDYTLISQAVVDGKAEPIDQYVRLRSLTGWAGTFTKLGVTGLPLVTVFLTLVFSAVSLLPFKNAAGFLDLAKLTLGAFIGSFVQRSVEQRKQEASSGNVKTVSREDLPT